MFVFAVRAEAAASHCVVGLLGASVAGTESNETQRERMEQFARLLGSCQRQVFLFALGILHNTADAEEVLQETNLVLWRKFDQYQPGTEFVKWARQVAYFEVLKFRERHRSNEIMLTAEAVDRLAAESHRQADMADVRRAALQKCMEKLRNEDRRLLTLRYQEGQPTGEAAKLLGRSIQGVRKSLHRIRMALLGCIERTLAAEQR